MHGSCCWYPNILLKEGLAALRKEQDNQMDKYISSNTVCDLAEVLLKKQYFKIW